MYDVIVVGARCAGSPVAMLLARRGHRVLVVDRATFPSDVVSTHYLHQSGLAQLRDWGLLDALDASNITPIRRASFGYRDLDLSGWAEPVNGIDYAYAPRRYVLDEILVNGARNAGVELIEGFTVTELVHSEGAVVGIRGHEADGTEKEFRAGIVVGADGWRSTVAKLTGAAMYNVRPASGVNYYAYYRNLDWHVHHKVGNHGKWGGAWPTNDGLMTVTVVCLKTHLKEFRKDIEGNWHAVMDDVWPQLGEELRDKGERVGDMVAMPHPDNFYRHPWGPGWVLVGDAGYQKDPYSGFGITDAFTQAEILADRLHRALSGECTMDDALRGYHKVRDEISALPYDFTTRLAEFTELPPMLHSMLKAMTLSEAWGTKFFGFFAGGVEHHEIFSPTAIKRLYEDAGLPESERVYQ